MSESTEADTITPSLGFAEADFSWNRYLQVRSKYPNSLFQELYPYHETHASGEKWSLAMDMGAGHGVIAQELAKRFQRVAVCDPNQEYLSYAHSRLSTGTNGQYDFHQRGGEDKFLDQSTANVIVFGMSIHWTDTERFIAAAAHHLRPGGTLAVIFYRRPYLIGNEKAALVWEEVWDNVLGHLIETEQLTSPVDYRSWNLESSGMDGLDFPPDLFHKVKRIKINRNSPGNHLGFSFSRKHCPPLESFVRVTDVIKEIENEADWSVSNLDATGWINALKSYCAGLTVFDSDATESVYFQQLTIALETSEGIATAVHPASLFFATRR